MENTFNLIITKILFFLDKDKQCSQTQFQQMYYGLQILAYNIMVATFILIFAAITRSFLSSLLVLIVFGTFRILAGGYHFNHMGACLLSTTAIVISAGKCTQFISFSTPVTIFLCIVLNIILLSYLPKGTAKNPFSDSFSRIQQKRLRIASVTMTLLALFFLHLRSGILLAMIFAVIFLLPSFIHQIRIK